MDKTQTYISNKLFQKAGIVSEISKIGEILTETYAYMTDIELQRITDGHQRELVQQIKDAVYNADDVMDEFHYHLLNEKSMKEQNMVSRITSSMYKVAIGNDKFQKRMKTVLESLDRAKESASKLWQPTNTGSTSAKLEKHADSRVTGPILHNSNVIGRAKDREALIELLLQQDDEPPTVIPIVGQGGIGKTTLAQMVFNDERMQGRLDPEQQRKVNGHFDLTMWISVNHNFDKVRLTKEMLKHASRERSTVDINFGILTKELESEVQSKKVLVVLDDVWFDNKEHEVYGFKEKWSIVLAPFKKASVSKILLTTRLNQVAELLCSVDAKPVLLEGLSPEDSWALFKGRAFGDFGQEHDQTIFEPIGREIVKKLGGSALAINVVGAQLRRTLDIEQWKRFLNNDLSGTNEIMDHLYLSYEYLPKHLQPCFAYCSLFGKDLHLKPDRVVYMWIAQGFVYPNGTESLEEIGRGYFDDLVYMSFFQMLIQGEEIYYVMHDLMNDLACHVSKGECFLLENGSKSEELNSVRHLSVCPEAANMLQGFTGIDKLRTLIVLKGPNDQYLDENTLRKLEKVRVLEIRQPSFRLTSHISQCIHLRYLSFPNADNPLPPIGKLHHLRIFIKDMYED